MTRLDVPRFTVRAVHWPAPAIACTVSVLAVVLGSWGALAPPMQLAGILLAASAAFALDDPAFGLLASSPTPLPVRRLWRLAVVVPVLVVVWAGLLVWLDPTDRQETLTLAVMFAGLLGLSVGVSAVAGTRTGGRGGAIAAPSLLVAIVLSSIVPPQWRPLPLGDIPGGWFALQSRWAAACLVGLAAFAWASRSPVSMRSQRGVSAVRGLRAGAGRG